MDKVRRILVYVCKDRASPQRAQFVQSVTGYFSDEGEDQVEVKCSLDKNRLVLSRGGQGGGVTLKRPAFCPIKHLSVTEAAAVPLDVQQRGVDVGVAVLLQTANHRVLLTRRAKELRVFPNLWVPPGGHMETDETLLSAGLRELQEETGLSLNPEDVCPKILGLWESVYPLLSSRPHNHHIVVFMLLHSPLSDLQLQACLRPSPAEVSACVWVDERLGRAIVSAVDGEDGDVHLDQLEDNVSVSQVSSESLMMSSLPLQTLISRAPMIGPDVERVSTGTKFALWLRELDL